MIVGSIVLAMVLVLPHSVPSRPDSIRPAQSSGDEATSAPADSGASRYGLDRIDPRLLPTPAIRAFADTLPRRRRASVEYSDWYYRRLQVHRWGSYVELPLFAAEYWLGNKLISPGEAPASWVKPTHVGVAASLAGLFGLNTLTGVWNLYDSRNDTDQRALVWSHSALMLAADAGFAVTGLIAGDAKHSTASANRHRNVGLTSMGLATAGTLLMWVKRGL